MGSNQKKVTRPSSTLINTPLKIHYKYIPFDVPEGRYISPKRTLA
jgi:hypothetical protein